jgi:glutathione S-transferase
MLALYHAPHSTCSQKVRILLAEKGLEWESRLVNLRRFEHLEPAFLAINPDALVPVLVHDGRILRNSLVISEYLEDAFPQTSFRPVDLVARARMREWTVYVSEEPSWSVKVPSFNKNLRPELVGRYSDAELAGIAARIPNRETAARWMKAAKEGFSEAELAASVARFVATLDRMERALADGPWLAGADYSLADIDMAPFVHRMAAVGEAKLIEARPRTADWYARMQARPGVRKGLLL